MTEVKFQLEAKITTGGRCHACGRHTGPRNPAKIVISSMVVGCEACSA